ncbi:Golgi vesicle transport [Spatholobus suberectus]|nr:Golgi vesicle transport [Spatholobus suberectus]
MASSFDRWEKDPFFNAAEEVQESADRMESTYRTWIHAMRDASSPWNCDEIRRDLHTALGTAKWQLEEFERAVRTSYSKVSSEDARNRHRDFIDAIGNKITEVEHLLQESAHSGSKASLPWTRLDEGEQDELASFLSGMPAAGGKNPIKCISRDDENLQLSDKDSFSNCSSNLHVSSGWGLSEAAQEKSHGHRRAASADADIGSWKITVSDNVQQSSSSNGSSGPIHKVASLSGFFGSMETISKLKWPKNGYRKLKAVNHCEEMDNTLLPSAGLNGGVNAYYERSKSCLDNCDECYDKQLHGWYGVLQRQLQRSQYQMQYNRHVQITVWAVILLCLIGRLWIFVCVCAKIYTLACSQIS